MKLMETPRQSLPSGSNNSEATSSIFNYTYGYGQEITLSGHEPPSHINERKTADLQDSKGQDVTTSSPLDKPTTFHPKSRRLLTPKSSNMKQELSDNQRIIISQKSNNRSSILSEIPAPSEHSEARQAKGPPEDIAVTTYRPSYRLTPSSLKELQSHARTVVPSAARVKEDKSDLPPEAVGTSIQETLSTVVSAPRTRHGPRRKIPKTNPRDSLVSALEIEQSPNHPTDSGPAGQSILLSSINDGSLHEHAVGGDQARAWNLATKVMSNGVEVIVATDKSTLPGEPEMLRVLPSSPITLAPSTLTDHMMLLLPSQVELDSAQFVTRTYLTTYTLVEPSSSTEHVVSNVATEQVSPESPERVTNAPTIGVTLTASPVLSTAVYHTTYTYLNTLLDGEVPLVLTSRKTVANTVTAPQEVLATRTQEPDISTNTYLSTVQLTRTLNEGDEVKVVSTQDVLTQIVITESEQQAQLSKPVKSTPALPTDVSLAATTTEVVKTYLVTYTYYSTFLEGDSTVVRSAVSVSTDITTETFLKKPKRTSTLNGPEITSTTEATRLPTPTQTLAPGTTPTPESIGVQSESQPPIHIMATKTYLTTFTYFTTLLQPPTQTGTSQPASSAASTVVSSRTRLVQNVVTETVATSLLHPDYLQRLRSSFRADPALESSQIVATATLMDGQQMEITAMLTLPAVAESTEPVEVTEPAESLSSTPTPALSAALTAAPSAVLSQSVDSSSRPPASNINDKVITGSTIIFFDDPEPADRPSSTSSSGKASQHKAPHTTHHSRTSHSSSSSRSHKPAPSKTHKHKVKPSTGIKEKPSATAALGNTYRTSVLSSRTVTPTGATVLPGEQVIVLSRPDGSEVVIPVGDPATNKRPSGDKVAQHIVAPEQGSNLGMSDLLQLGSLGINGINALRPVFSAMAGLLSPAKEEPPVSNKQPVLVVHKHPTHLVPSPFQKLPPPAPILPPLTSPATSPLLPAPAPTSPAPILDLTFPAPQPPERLVGAGTSNTPQRNPIYIPVGGIAGHAKDSVAEESQRIERPVKLNAVWPDTEQRLKLTGPGGQLQDVNGVVLGRPTLESPLLSGGIPIQPGQVITTNSDVIIGKPSVHGPRPPKRPDQTPIGMKPPPPPPPPQATWLDERLPEDTVEHGGDDSLGLGAHAQHHLPTPAREHHDHLVPAATGTDGTQDQRNDVSGLNPPGSSQTIPNQEQEHIHDLLPPPLQEDHPGGGPVIPLHHKVQEILDLSPPVDQPLVVHAPSEDVPLRPPPPPPQFQHNLAVHGQAVFGHPVSQKINVDQPALAPETITVPIILPGNPQIVERASGLPLLVNIQPSQVANVIIPHGSSTALIYSGDTLEHGKKGEYFDDPLPYPDTDPSRGGTFSGAPKPSSAIRMDVPIPPEGIQVQISAGNAVQGPTVHVPTAQVHHPQQPNFQGIPVLNEIKVGGSALNHDYHLEHHKQLNTHLEHHQQPSQEHGNNQNPSHNLPDHFQQKQPHHGPHLPVHQHLEHSSEQHKHSVPRPQSERRPDRPPPPQFEIRPDHHPHPRPESHPRPEGRPDRRPESPSFHRPTPIFIPLPPSPAAQSHHHQFVNEVPQHLQFQEHRIPVQVPISSVQQQNLHIQQQQMLHNQQLHDQHLQQQHQHQQAHHVPQHNVHHQLNPQNEPSAHHHDVHRGTVPGLDEPVDYMMPPPVTAIQGPGPNGPRPQRPGIQEDQDQEPEDNEPIESEGGELIQESNARPLRPGQVPIEIEVANSKSTERPKLNEEAFGDRIKSPHSKTHDNPPFKFERPNSKPVNFDIETPVKSTIIFEQRPAQTPDAHQNNLDQSLTTKPILPSTTLRPAMDLNYGDTPPPPTMESKPSNIGSYGETPPSPPSSEIQDQPPIINYGDIPPLPSSTFTLQKPVKIRPEKDPLRRPTSSGEHVLGMAPPHIRRPPNRRRPPPPYKFEMPPPPADTMKPPTELPVQPTRPSPTVPSQPLPAANPTQTESRPFPNRPPVLEMAKPLPPITLPGSLPGESVHHEIKWPDQSKRYSTTRRPPAPFARPQSVKPTKSSLFSTLAVSSASESGVNSNQFSHASTSITPTRVAYSDIRGPSSMITTPSSASPEPSPITPTTVRGRYPPSRHKWAPASPSVETVTSSEPPIPSMPTLLSPFSTPVGNFYGKSSQGIGTFSTRTTPTRHISILSNRFTRPSTTERFSVTPTRDPSLHTRYVSPPYRAPPRRPSFVDTSAADSPASPSSVPSPSPSLLRPVPVVSTRFVTHTQTLVLTTTETTVVRSEGQSPTTQTVLLTSTTTSTIVDTVTETETHTLVKPTSVFETVTTTVSHTHTTTHTQTAEPPVLPTIYAPWHEANLTPDVQLDHEEVPSVEDNHHTAESGTQEEDKEPDIITEQDGTENDSIFLVMTDQKPGVVQVHKVPPVPVDDEPTNVDETNEVKNNAVLLGGVLVASPPAVRPAGDHQDTHLSHDEDEHVLSFTEETQCNPQCSAARNELCQRLQSVMRCVCRPGFARMFPDQPCKPTYTYSMRLALDRHGGEVVRFAEWLSDPSSPRFARLAEATKEGLERVVMQSELRDVAHGVVLQGFAPSGPPPHGHENVVVNFFVQLSDNTDELKLKDVFRKSLRATNFSLGGTEVFAAREMLPELDAADFDECLSPRFHDCSEDARCFNLHGTYTCSCKEGYADVSENPQFPGRACSAEQVGCEQCHYHGTCYSRGPGERPVCECFQWYTGQNCHINLKVLLIALGALGAVLLLLLVLCCVLSCARRRRPHHPPRAPPPGFLRYRGPTHPHRDLDTRAMIHDTSSEGSIDNSPLPPYVTAMHKPVHTLSAKHTKKGGMKKVSHAHAQAPAGPEQSNTGTMEQRDRSLTVMIPRAKYRSAPGHPQAQQPLSTFIGDLGEHEVASPSRQEHKLLSYLDSPQPSPVPVPVPPPPSGSRKPSESGPGPGPGPGHRKGPAPKKPSTGALVSAGFEVSATVVRRTTDLDDETFSRDGASSHRHEQTLRSQHSHFDTQRTRGGDRGTAEGSCCCPADQLAARLADLTVSEARSCDETTIQPPTKCIHSHASHYASSKPSSHSNHNNDESHTMVERDLGSTFLMPQTHLYQPDRGSDISNFDSL